MANQNRYQLANIGRRIRERFNALLNEQQEREHQLRILRWLEDPSNRAPYEIIGQSGDDIPDEEGTEQAQIESKDVGKGH